MKNIVFPVKKRPENAWGLLLLIIFALFALSQAYAHGNAKGIVKERMDFMKSMGDASKGIGKIFKGQAPYNIDNLVEYSRTLAEQSPHLLDFFPHDSLEPPSEALPTIWEQWDKFEQINQRLKTETAQLLDVAQQGDKKQIRVQFARVAKACKSCHEDFRQEKE